MKRERFEMHWICTSVGKTGTRETEQCFEPRSPTDKSSSGQQPVFYLERAQVEGIDWQLGVAVVCRLFQIRPITRNSRSQMFSLM